MASVTNTSLLAYGPGCRIERRRDWGARRLDLPVTSEPAELIASARVICDALIGIVRLRDLGDTRLSGASPASSNIWPSSTRGLDGQSWASACRPRQTTAALALIRRSRSAGRKSGRSQTFRGLDIGNCLPPIRHDCPPGHRARMISTRLPPASRGASWEGANDRQRYARSRFLAGNRAPQGEPARRTAAAWSPPSARRRPGDNGGSGQVT